MVILLKLSKKKKFCNFQISSTALKAPKIQIFHPCYIYMYRSIIFSYILDLCTTNKMINNNNKTNKTIWSPASSCEEENEMKMASGNGLACHTCQRHFGSPTKLELHYRKVHNHPASSSEPSVASKASRKERVFKVCYVYRYTGTLSCISE